MAATPCGGADAATATGGDAGARAIRPGGATKVGRGAGPTPAAADAPDGGAGAVANDAGAAGRDRVHCVRGVQVGGGEAAARIAGREGRGAAWTATGAGADIGGGVAPGAAFPGQLSILSGGALTEAMRSGGGAGVDRRLGATGAA